jgi:hypothetical protein
MIKPRVESIELVNGRDLETLELKDPQRFHVTVRAMIGPDPGEGEESFDFRVCSQEWMNEEIEKRGYFLGRQMVISHWNVALVRRAINAAISPIVADSWKDLAMKLSAFASWEFEDYREGG